MIPLLVFVIVFVGALDLHLFAAIKELQERVESLELQPTRIEENY